MKRMTKVWGMLCLAGLLISLYLGVSFLVPKQGKIVLTFGMFSGNQSDVPNDDCYKIIDETIKEFESNGDMYISSARKIIQNGFLIRL